jgi:hypothetical protein
MQTNIEAMQHVFPVERAEWVHSNDGMAEQIIARSRIITEPVAFAAGEDKTAVEQLAHFIEGPVLPSDTSVTDMGGLIVVTRPGGYQECYVLEVDKSGRTKRNLQIGSDGRLETVPLSGSGRNTKIDIADGALLAVFTGYRLLSRAERGHARMTQTPLAERSTLQDLYNRISTALSSAETKRSRASSALSKMFSLFA